MFEEVKLDMQIVTWKEIKGIYKQNTAPFLKTGIPPVYFLENYSR